MWFRDTLCFHLSLPFSSISIWTPGHTQQSCPIRSILQMILWRGLDSGCWDLQAASSHWSCQGHLGLWTLVYVALEFCTSKQYWNERLTGHPDTRRHRLSLVEYHIFIPRRYNILRMACSNHRDRSHPSSTRSFQGFLPKKNRLEGIFLLLFTYADADGNTSPN